MRRDGQARRALMTAQERKDTRHLLDEDVRRKQAYKAQYMGRPATAPGAFEAKTKELIALALSVAARCDPCIGLHAKALAKLSATRHELDEACITTYMGGGPSLMYAPMRSPRSKSSSRHQPGRLASCG